MIPNHNTTHSPRTKQVIFNNSHHINIGGKEMKVFEDKKVPIYAGMDFKGHSNRIRKIGYKIIRFVFDNENADCLLTEKEIKRVIF